MCVCFSQLHSPVAGSRMNKPEKIPPSYNIYKMIFSYDLELNYILSPWRCKLFKKLIGFNIIVHLYLSYNTITNPVPFISTRCGEFNPTGLTSESRWLASKIPKISNRIMIDKQSRYHAPWHLLQRGSRKNRKQYNSKRKRYTYSGICQAKQYV